MVRIRPGLELRGFVSRIGIVSSLGERKFFLPTREMPGDAAKSRVGPR